MLYHIFSVYDYKGGELSTNLNLTLERAINVLYSKYRFEDFWEENEEQISDLEEAVDLWIGEKSDDYAGGDGMVVEVYKTEGEKLVEGFDDDLFNGLVELIRSEEN